MTPQESARELVESFELFDDWEDRYRFLIDLGRKLPPLDESQKTDENKVHGCQSNVWMVSQKKPDGTLDFVADSDSSIVRGLIGVLREVYAGRTPQEIQSYRVEELFGQIGFDQHLSMGRRNGLDGMVKRIRSLAAQN
jgi:sulfur transfer protein SufE